MSDDSDWLDVAGKIAMGVGVGALTVAGTLVAKSGAVQSAVARWRRNADKRMVDAPEAGTPLLVSLARGGAEHSGVYLGDGSVAELSGDGRLQEVSLSEFLNGQDVGAADNFRSGTRIFAACDDATAKPLSVLQVAEAARRLIRHIGRVDYNLFGNNCHMFTASCVFGTLLEKLSAVDWLKDGTFSIERLEETIRHRMNHGLQIAWLGVRGPTPQFNYALTAEKTARLRDEGLV